MEHAWRQKRPGSLGSPMQERGRGDRLSRPCSFLTSNPAKRRLQYPEKERWYDTCEVQGCCGSSPGASVSLPGNSATRQSRRGPWLRLLFLVVKSDIPRSAECRMVVMRRILGAVG